MIGLIGTALGLIGDLAGNWLERKKSESEEKLKVARAKAVAEINWDIEMARASASSWKDEYWTVILSIPLILCFFPDTAPYIKEGFETLKSSVPEWYIAAVGAAIAAAFGYRGFHKVMNKRSKK
jgi:magnesium-transporting ATPase (P-type)